MAAKTTEKQKLFCEEYLLDLNATQAAVRAGYSPNTAAEQAARLLRNVNIRTRIDRALAERSRRTGISADIVLEELGKLLRVNADDVINMDDATVIDGATREDKAAIASVKVKVIPVGGGKGNIVEREVKLYDKIKAIELAGRHLGMFTDNINLSADVGVQIVNDIPKDNG